MLNYLYASPILLSTETQYGFTDEDSEAMSFNLKNVAKPNLKLHSLALELIFLIAKGFSPLGSFAKSAQWPTVLKLINSFFVILP